MGRFSWSYQDWLSEITRVFIRGKQEGQTQSRYNNERKTAMSQAKQMSATSWKRQGTRALLELF